MRVLVPFLLLPLLVLVSPLPAGALSCGMPTPKGVLEQPGAVVGRVLEADLERDRVVLAVDETLRGGPFPDRLVLPAWGMGWDDWEGPAMRTGPVLFMLHEQEDGDLATGACSFVLDKAFIQRVRTLAASTPADPVVAAPAEIGIETKPASDRGAWVFGGLVATLVATLVAAAAIGAVRRRRVSPSTRGT